MFRRSRAGERDQIKDVKQGLTASKRMILITLLLFLMFSVFPLIVAEAAIDVETLWVETSDPTTTWDSALDVAVDSSAVYIAGHQDGNKKVRIEKRSLTDGSVIWTVVDDVSSWDDQAWGIAVDNVGLYIVGRTSPSVLNDWLIEKRRLSDGEVILWSASYSPSSGNDLAWDVAVDTTGVYIVGHDSSPGNYQWRIEKRSLALGSLIWEKTRNQSGYDDSAYGVAVDDTGVYVVGDDRTQGSLNPQWRIEKLSLEGVGQWNATSYPTSSNIAYKVAVDSSGIYVAGCDNVGWRIEKRSKTDGSLITSFGSGTGFVISNTYSVAPNDITVDSTWLYVFGNENGRAKWRIEKRDLTDGSLIWAKTIDPSFGDDGAYGVAVDSSGIYVVGNDETPGYLKAQWRMMKLSKYANLGSIDTSTGSGTANIKASNGDLIDFTAVDLATLPPPYGGLQFPHGLFTFKITGLTPGATVTVTITLPSAVPVGTLWHKYHASVGWISLPIGSDDGDNVITITITDDGTGDFDPTDGVILDPGGPAYYAKEVGGEVLPVDKIALLTPYIAATVLIVTTATIIKKRWY